MNKHEHIFERFELKTPRPVYAAGVFTHYAETPFYIGYHCRLCGEAGYSLNLASALRAMRGIVNLWGPG